MGRLLGGPFAGRILGRKNRGEIHTVYNRVWQPLGEAQKL